MEAASNYCRDPNRNISGPWCYTTDINVPFDLCNIRDCEKKEEFIIMTKGNGVGRDIYILPQWKEHGPNGGLVFSLKEWNPDNLDGIIFEITPLSGKGWLRLVIGAENNEKVTLTYGEHRPTGHVVKEKTFLHLIPAGKWGTFWLQMRRGEIMLGFEGIEEPFFEWTLLNQKGFEPIFVTYMSIEDNIIGVNFKSGECHTERTETSHYTRIMPLGLWSTAEEINYNNISFYLRGTGIALIPLMLLPGSGEYYAVTVGDFVNYIIFIYNTRTQAKNLKAVKFTHRVIYPNNWTHILISYSENHLEIFYNNASVLKYTSKMPLLFYWFSVAAENGWITW